MTDADYIRILAEKGDPEGQYLMGKLLYPHGGYHDKYGHISGKKDNGTEVKKNIDEALKWWLKAAEQGEVNAQFNLGLSYRDKPEYHDDALKWLTKASEQGDRMAQRNLSSMYERGTGASQNYSEAYFWSGVSFDSTIKERVSEYLTTEEQAKIDARIKDWRASHSQPRASKSIEKLINIDGLMCNGHTKGCRIADTCGDLAGVVCTGEEIPYYILNTKTKKTVSRCAFGHPAYGGDWRCKEFVPAEWTCGSPKNMPISAAEWAEHDIKAASIVSCGAVLGVDIDAHADGPYDFIKRDTGAEIQKYFGRGGVQKMPAEWTCGWPSNF